MSDETLLAARAAARIKLLDKPLVPPGKCAVCGAVDRQVIDIGLDVEWYGVIYFCIECVTDMGSTIGMVPAAMLADNERLTKQLIEDYCKTHDYSLVSNEQYQRLAYARGVLDSIVLPLGLDSIPEPEADEGDGGIEPQDSSVISGADIQDEFSPVGEGPDGVSDDPSDEFRFDF